MRRGSGEGRGVAAGSGPSTEYTVQIYRLNLHLGPKTNTYIVCKCRCSSCRKISGVVLVYGGWGQPLRAGCVAWLGAARWSDFAALCGRSGEKKRGNVESFLLYFFAQPTDLPQRYPYCPRFLLGYPYCACPKNPCWQGFCPLSPAHPPPLTNFSKATRKQRRFNARRWQRQGHRYDTVRVGFYGACTWQVLWLCIKKIYYNWLIDILHIYFFSSTDMEATCDYAAS